MIRDGQCAAPGFGSDGAVQIGEQRLRVAIGDGQHGNFHDGCGFTQGQALRAGFRCPAGRERIARIQREVEDTAALDTVGRAIGAVRINVALKVAVFARIRINNAADRAVLRRDLWLRAPKTAAVARDDDLAAHVDAAVAQKIVVGGQAEVYVDQRRGDIAIAGVCVVSRNHAGVV